MSARRVTIIAEVGSVHDGSFGNARRLIDLAAEAGADAVKFQTHIAAAETLPSAPSPSYFSDEPRYAYFERTSFSAPQWRSLVEHCRARGIRFLSSPFSHEAVDLLESVGAEWYKIPSGEVSNIPLIKHVAKTGKPVLLSSGMSGWSELDEAVRCVRAHHDRLMIMQCTSEYPCPPEQVGLNVMDEMAARYGTPVGLSDHTLDVFAPIAAVARGAAVIEKHLTFSRRMYGSDAKHSLEPHEFTQMAQGIRAVERMLAHPVDKSSAARFATMKATFEKSVVSSRDIPAGAKIEAHMIALKKPGTGIPARRLQDVIGLRAMRDIPADRLLDADDLEGFT